MAATTGNRRSGPVSAQLTLAASFPKTLVVEDNPHDALALQYALKQAGVTACVHFVSDGVEAIEYLRGKELFEHIASPSLPSLLLVGLDLPRLDGFGLLRWLRLRPHLRPARVVAFGSNLQPGEEARALALGADHYLLKPVPPADFHTALLTLQGFLIGALPSHPETTAAVA